jgi:hypothetical protein
MDSSSAVVGPTTSEVAVCVLQFLWEGRIVVLLPPVAAAVSDNLENKVNIHITQEITDDIEIDNIMKTEPDLCAINEIDETDLSDINMELLGRIVVLLPPVAAAVSDCGSICLTMLSKD